MDLARIPAGRAPPYDLNVVVEIPQGSQVKYAFDPDSGAMVVDRVLAAPMAYPAAYGFIPGTLAEDGAPIGVLVLLPAPVVPGCVLRARPIGVLLLEDASGPDAKIVCVPHDEVHPVYAGVTSAQKLPAITRNAIEHFFATDKDLEAEKWVKVKGWGSAEDAASLIRTAIAAGRTGYRTAAE